MKNLIEKSLLKASAELEDPCFCKIAIHGGYENYLRDIIFFELTKSFPGQYDIEYRYGNLRFDLVKINTEKKLETIIQLGHNGTWQPENFVRDHAIKNVNDWIAKEITGIDIYTVSIITDIQQLNESELFRIPRSYVGGAKKNINNGFTMIKKIGKTIEAIDPNYLPVKPFVAKWNSFEVKIYVFIAGPFRNLIDIERL